MSSNSALSTKQLYLSFPKLCDTLWEISNQKKLKVSLNQSFHLIDEKCLYVNKENKEQCIIGFRLHYQ